MRQVRIRLKTEQQNRLPTAGQFLLLISSFRFSSLAERIEIIGRLHRELSDLAEMIRDFFSPPLIIIITMNFIQLVAHSYITWLSIVGYKSMDLDDVVSFIMIVIWLAVNLAEPFVITEVCSSTSKEVGPIFFFLASLSRCMF